MLYANFSRLSCRALCKEVSHPYNVSSVQHLCPVVSLAQLCSPIITGGVA